MSCTEHSQGPAEDLVSSFLRRHHAAKTFRLKTSQRGSRGRTPILSHLKKCSDVLGRAFYGTAVTLCLPFRRDMYYS